mgnify:CR=1 FL=1
MIKFLPKKLDLFLRNLRALKESFKSYLYDYLRFSKYSIKKTFPDDKTQLQSKIISLKIQVMVITQARKISTR